ncbi:MAG: methyltransferase domain-containing protein [Thermoguttaceae bacterium]|nr:methyltransferase domain-containing protein [Thermoguttaceae bacterium]
MSDDVLKQSERVREHFDSAAGDFDDLIPKLIPDYDAMTTALVDSVPFKSDDPIRAIDLGCGTGAVTCKFAKRFPLSHITAVDNAQHMLDIARERLAFHLSSRFVNADFNTMSFDEKYQVIFSSLALHHLVSDEDKIRFYRHCFGALVPGGFFVNFDPVLPSLPEHVILYAKRHDEYMNAHLSPEEAQSRWHKKRKEEDFPAKLIDHLKWMGQVGFSCTDIVCKEFSLAIWCGTRPLA